VLCCAVLCCAGDYWGWWKAARSYHHTGPVSTFYALREALAIVGEEGLQPMWDRHLKVRLMTDTCGRSHGLLSGLLLQAGQEAPSWASPPQNKGTCVYTAPSETLRSVSLLMSCCSLAPAAAAATSCKRSYRHWPLRDCAASVVRYASALLCLVQAHQQLWAGLTKLGLEPFVEKPTDRWQLKWCSGVILCCCICWDAAQAAWQAST
jgi:hypothetical protein